MRRGWSGKTGTVPFFKDMSLYFVPDYKKFYRVTTFFIIHNGLCVF
jgi:hypothetical protein